MNNRKDLDARKIRILQAIIKDYVQTGEPVGSRTISKKYDLGVSSATIRNEMSDLEELGFIIQPHTSAGRIPSDMGYRLYVDRLMECSTLNSDKIHIIQKLLKEKVDQIDSLLQEAAKLLSLLTHYTTMISAPQLQKIKLKQMQLVAIDNHSALLVIVTDANIVKNYALKMNVPADQDTLYKLSNMLNHYLEGLTVEEINLPLIQKLKGKMGVYEEIVSPILDAIAQTIQSENAPDVYLSGAMNMLTFPEFSDVLKSRPLLQILEEKERLISLLSQTQPDGIQITIGAENEMEEIKNCSVITATYSIADCKLGTIGIIGPTRMEYAKVVSILSHIVKNMDELLQQLSGG